MRGAEAGEDSGIIPSHQANVLLQSLLSTKDTYKNLGILIYFSQRSSVDIDPEFENEAYHIVILCDTFPGLWGI